MDQVECSDIIQDYYHKPEPTFFGNGPRFFGVELEIDEAGESSRNAWELLSIANREGEKRLYCKHDGSLNDGFEMVTHPSLKYMAEEVEGSFTFTVLDRKDRLFIIKGDPPLSASRSIPCPRQVRSISSFGKNIRRKPGR